AVGGLATRRREERLVSGCGSCEQAVLGFEPAGPRLQRIFRGGWIVGRQHHRARGAVLRGDTARREALALLESCARTKPALACELRPEREEGPGACTDDGGPDRSGQHRLSPVARTSGRLQDVAGIQRRKRKIRDHW